MNKLILIAIFALVGCGETQAGEENKPKPAILPSDCKIKKYVATRWYNNIHLVCENGDVYSFHAGEPNFSNKIIDGGKHGNRPKD